jgi:hypothetical protein
LLIESSPETATGTGQRSGRYLRLTTSRSACQRPGAADDHAELSKPSPPGKRVFHGLSRLAGLSTQLVDRYLTRPGLHAGIYLIGYFHSPLWTRDDNRKHPDHLSDLRAEQAKTAASEAEQKAVCVAAFILDLQLTAS